MSNAQWGNGYWKGVEDAQKNAVKTNMVELLARFYCCHFMISNSTKINDSSLYPVREFIFLATVWNGQSEALAKKIYNYIMEHQPYGCYVSGANDGPWDKDYFVIGNMTVDECLEEIRKIEEEFKQ